MQWHPSELAEGDETQKNFMIIVLFVLVVGFLTLTIEKLHRVPATSGSSTHFISLRRSSDPDARREVVQNPGGVDSELRLVWAEVFSVGGGTWLKN